MKHGANISTKMTDLGWNRTIRNMHAMDRAYVMIGVQQGERHKDQDTGVTSDLVDIAASNEFGVERKNPVTMRRKSGGKYLKVTSKKVPERSFLRSTADEQRENIARQVQVIAAAIIDGKMSVHKGLMIIGLEHARQIKRKILMLRHPANSLMTILKKGSSNPLIDTGQLMQSIRAKVHL